MRLAELIAGLPDACNARLISGDGKTEIRGIADDSRAVVAGDIFIGVAGTKRDGREFLADAVAGGAVAAVIVGHASEVTVTGDDAEGSGDDAFRTQKVDHRLHQLLARHFPIAMVTDSRLAHAWLPFIFHGHPDRRLALVGVTGTNGKTTTASLVRQIAQGSGRRAAEIGTVGVWRPGADRHEPLLNTTPSPVAIARLLREFADDGVEVVAMEVSSHAIHQRRVAAMQFRVGVLTNITQDHLDYHGTMEEYARVKMSWLESVARQAEPGAIALNLDDRVGAALAGFLRREGARVVTYGQNHSTHADFLAAGAKPVPSGTRVVWRLGDLHTEVVLPLAGLFNVSNALAALAACSALGIAPGEGLRELSWATAPPGRFQRIDAGQRFTALVDYAHTPDALDNVLRQAAAILEGLAETQLVREANAPPYKPVSAGAINLAETLPLPREDEETPPPPADRPGRPPLDPDEEDAEDTAPVRLGRLLVVFGAGGDRDRAKRPEMMAAVARRADVAIVTSDNPRSEDPDTIIDEVVAGLPVAAAVEMHRVADRRAAIRRAVELAATGDVLVVAGKGHEDYQEIAGERLPFDDAKELREALLERIKAAAADDSG